MYDLILRGGTVVDGTGRSGFRADVGVIGDRIAMVDPASGGVEARRTEDVSGKIVAPGVIDR